MALNEKQLAKALREAADTGRDVRLTDTSGSHGSGTMQFRATPKGGRFYYRYMRPDGKGDHLPIGPYHPSGGAAGLTLKDAREKYRKWSDLYRSGMRDVRAHVEAEERARQKAVQQPQADPGEAASKTLRALLTGYVADLETKGKQSARDVRNHIRLNIYDAHPEIADTRAADVTPEQVTVILSTMIERGVGRTTGKVRSYIRRAYQLGLSAKLDPRVPSRLKGFDLTTNPAAIVPALTEYNRARTRVLTEAELGHFLAALHARCDSVAKDALLVALYTGGQRMTQLCRLRLADVDLAGSEITIYDGKGKRSEAREHVLPLTDLPHAIIERRVMFANARKHDLIFTVTGRAPISESVPGRIVSDSISPEMVEAKTAREPFLLCDIRRTCETLMAKMGIGNEVRGHVQSHGLGGVQNRHYNRHEYYTEKQEALARWETFLNELAAGHKVTAGRERAEA